MKPLLPPKRKPRPVYHFFAPPVQPQEDMLYYGVRCMECYIPAFQGSNWSGYVCDCCGVTYHANCRDAVRTKPWFPQQKEEFRCSHCHQQSEL